MNTRAIARLKEGLWLTARQRDILVGMLLGDGHLERQNSRGAARLTVEHAVRQSEYVMWKYSEWQDWVLTPPRTRAKTNNLGTTSFNIGFSTVSHSVLGQFRSLFYEEGKRVPPDLALSPLSLAVWFMDDGSRKSAACRALLLNTQGFRQGDVLRLRQALERDFGIHTSQRHQGDGIQIYIPSSQVGAFIDVINPHVIPGMRYKLPR